MALHLQRPTDRRLDAKACCCFYKILDSSPLPLVPLNISYENRAAPPCFYYRAWLLLCAQLGLALLHDLWRGL